MPAKKPTLKSDLARVDAMRDEDIVYDDDSPDMGDNEDFWDAGFRGFPPPKKQPLSLRVDEDVIAWFKERTGDRGYQTLMNFALRVYMGRTQRLERERDRTPVTPKGRYATNAEGRAAGKRVMKKHRKALSRLAGR
jgi:uncharacterized protein (DUF4415 family)